MNISALSIRNPVPVIMFFLLSILVGLFSFKKLNVQNFPDLSLPTITVSAVLPGAAPPQLETEVAKKIENSVASLEKLKTIKSTVQDGTVSVMVEFELEKDVQEALDEVTSAVNSIGSQLPPEMDAPIVNKVKFSNSPIKIYSMSSKSMTEENLSWYIDNDLTKRLLSIKGVSEVKRVGGKTREVQVLIDPVKLKSLGVTVADISRQLKSLQFDTTAGEMKIAGVEKPIRAIATIETAKDLGLMEISTNRGLKVLLSDIAEIKDTYAEVTSSAYFNGEKVVGFEVKRTSDANELELEKELIKEVEKIQKENPDFVINEAFDFVEVVRDTYSSSMQLLLEGALLAIIVVFLFLKDGRATLVSAIALPLSIIPTFAFLYAMDYTINGITLLSLSLVVGILVDDAIVEVENIERHINDGKSAYEAAIEATQEIGLAVVATTFTLIAVFLPTAFMGGVPGLVFKQFGWTSAIAVFVSLVVARLLTPLMAAYIMKKVEHKEVQQAKWLVVYEKMARWSILNRGKTILIALVVFALSLTLIPMLPKGFIPPNNSNQSQISVELEPGASLEKTEKVVKQIEEKLKNVPEVLTVYSSVGGGNASMKFEGSSVTEPRKATMTLKLKPKKERDNKRDIENKIRVLLKEIPGAKINIGGNTSGNSYTLSLTGDDSEQLLTAAEAVEKELRQINGLGNISSSAALSREEVILNINFDRAAEMGVNTNTIAQTIKIATNGDFSNSLSKLNTSVRQVPIVVKLDENFKEDIENLLDLEVETKVGMVPLRELVDMEYKNGPSLIDRYDRSRTINLNIELGSVELGDLSAKIKTMEAVQKMPSGVKVLETGDAERMGELFAGFGLAMLTGVICIYIILVLLFKDLLQPITILVALPLSIGGAFLGLLLTGNSFSMPSLIGLIMLMGIATKNSILLVDYAIILKKEGVSQLEATIEACVKRARPIIMTTLAMGMGMLPVALDFGSGDGTFRAPMAIAVIGGLITSTVLSLLVIPSVFTIMEDLKGKLRIRR